MIQPGRKYSATDSYRYGFNGKENDNEVKGEGNQQDYGMRIYDSRLGKFLSVDPISKSYSQLTPYQYASNRPINGIDLDGLEWVLKIYDPQATTEFVAAINEKDIYKQRQIAYKAINSSLTAEQYLESCKKNPNIVKEATMDAQTGLFKGGELVYDKNAPEGVTFSYRHTQDSKTITKTTYSWGKGSQEGYHDIGYPVDVRTISSPEFDNYYGSNDFVGKYRAYGGIIHTGTFMKGDTWGHLKGYGYVHYAMDIGGISSSPKALAGNWGIMTGSFTGTGTYDQTTLEGWSTQLGASLELFEGGYWQGYANAEDAKNLRNPTFKGSFFGLNTTINPADFLKKKPPSKPGSGTGAAGLISYSTLVSYKKPE